MILEGPMKKDPSKCKVLGQFGIDLPGTEPNGVPKVEVEYSIDGVGNFTAVIKDLANSGNKQVFYRNNYLAKAN